MHRLIASIVVCFAVAASVLALLVASAPVAWAKNPPAQCDPSGGTCTVTVSSPGHGGGSNSSGGNSGNGGTGCVGVDGKDYPCYDPQLGYWSGKCYWKLMDPQPEYVSWDGHPKGDGAIYLYTCPPFTPGGDGGEGMEWEATQPGGPTVTPAQLAQEANKKLVVPQPSLVFSPTGQQLVNLPTWLAVTGWARRSASATVPGLSVTATARPTEVDWSLGDGSSLACDGPGTVFAAGDDPASASPTCGHTYRVSSAEQPSGAFAVTAIVRWSVSWAGGGQTGTLPALTREATVQVPVAESQALTTN